MFADGWLLAYRLMAWGEVGVQMFPLGLFFFFFGWMRYGPSAWHQLVRISLHPGALGVYSSASCYFGYLRKAPPLAVISSQVRSVIANLLACIAGHLHPFPYLYIRQFCQ